MSERKEFWTGEEVAEIMAEFLAEEGYVVDPRTITLGSISAGPGGMTRDEVKRGLRLLVTIPNDPDIDLSRGFAMHGVR